ncbi:hypothetical protein LZ30DRAFT_723413 [Colletotrichum cereale]|nr:hypothetical protein LZ30DRAFT_723413 [Colletotrichum cereale]
MAGYMLRCMLSTQYIGQLAIIDINFHRCNIFTTRPSSFERQGSTPPPPRDRIGAFVKVDVARSGVPCPTTTSD